MSAKKVATTVWNDEFAHKFPEIKIDFAKTGSSENNLAFYVDGYIVIAPMALTVCKTHKSYWREIFRHEIAHHLTNDACNTSSHGDDWKQIFIKMGGTGNPKFDPLEVHVKNLYPSIQYDTTHSNINIALMDALMEQFGKTPTECLVIVMNVQI